MSRRDGKLRNSLPGSRSRGSCKAQKATSASTTGSSGFCRQGERLTRSPAFMTVAGRFISDLLGHLAANFAGWIGRGVDVDVVLAGHQVGGLRVCQYGTAFDRA